MSPARTLGALRPTHAYGALARFQGGRGTPAMRLAMHAAVPQSFRADLLHLLKLNFVPEAGDDAAVEADVLLAPFSDDLGGGYFQFDPEVRRLLLDELADTYAHEPVPRVRRVADFLLAYVERAERRAPARHDRLGREFLETQRWVALAFARPEAAAEQLAAALQSAEQAPSLEARLHLGGLAQAVAIPLAHHRQLLDYALGLHALETGDQEAATDLLEPLQREFTVGSVTLVPARVPPPPPATPPVEPAEASSPSASSATAESREAAEPVGTVEEEAPPLRAFISSTVVDLGDYRDAAANACRRLGISPLLLEQWASDEGRVSLERTLQAVESADLFLCIVGRRLSYVPPGQDRSLMELELDHAQAAGIPVLCFFVDDERTSADADADADSVQRLREKLRARADVSVVHDYAQFRQQVWAALSGWRESRSPHGAADRGKDRAGTPAESPPRQLVLLYDRSESPFAQRLHQDLGAAGFDVWFNPLEPELRRDRRDIERRIEAADVVVLVVTPFAQVEDFVREDVLVALTARKPVFPVLRRGARPRDLGPEFAALRTFDFTHVWAYQPALDELLRSLGVPRTPQLGPLYGVPPLPASVVTRNEFAELWTLVVANQPRVTVLTGPGGTGKTAMALALAHVESVRQRFPDGIVWATVGADAGPEQVPEVLARALGNDGPGASALYGRTCLLILDGVENARVVEQLATLVGVHGHVLATTRNSDLARKLGANSLAIGGLSPAEASRLLAGQLEIPLDRLPREAREVADAVRGLPLALVQAAALVRAGAPWSNVLQRLRSEGPRALEQDVAAPGEEERLDQMPEGAVYISYAREDRRAAERLRAGLEQVTDVWMDEQELIAGGGYDRGTRRNISRCSIFVPVLSRNAVRREASYFRTEWNLAVERRERIPDGLPFIVPVIIDNLPAGAEGVPRAFREVQAAVLHGGEVTPEFLTGFVSQLRKVRTALRPGALRGDEPVPGRLYGVPHVPAGFVARERELAHLRDMVLAGESRVTVLAGRGDVGKTALAAALARDEAVRQRFPDGIVWASVGPDAGVEQVLATLSRALGDDVPAVSALYGQACLLVLDNVEDAGTVEHLATLAGVRGHVLATTRRSDLALRLRARVFELGGPPFSEAVRLLAEYLEVSVERLPAEAREVADAVGPDLDRLIRVAQQVRAGADWRNLLQKLHASGTLEPFGDEEMAGGMPEGAVFISYASEDHAMAERLAARLEEVTDVWLDRNVLSAGDNIDLWTRRSISRCSLFVPVLSRSAASRLDGYFRREWKLAVERRSRMAPDLPFIVPVIIDDLPVAAAGIPREFWEVQAAVLPGGEATDEFLASMRSQVRMARSAMRLGASPAPAGPVRQTGLSRWLGEHIVREKRDVHDLSRNSTVANFSFFAYHATGNQVEVVALCDADGLVEGDIIRLRDEFFDRVRTLPRGYGFQPTGRNPNGLLGFVFARGCSPEMARFIAKQTRISHAAVTGGMIVSWAIDAAERRIHTHENPVSVVPLVVQPASEVYPGLEYLQSLITGGPGIRDAVLGDAGLRTAGAEKIQVLVVSASSAVHRSIALGRDLRTIRTTLDLSRVRDQIVLQTARAERTRDLRQAMLEHRPNIVHFSGWGGNPEGIVLRSNTGQPHAVSGRVLESVFEQFRTTVRCVVLDSCWTDWQADAIRSHVPYVIGSRPSISEDGAVAFSTAFYQALAAGRHVPFAFQLGRARVQMERQENADLVMML